MKFLKKAVLVAAVAVGVLFGAHLATEAFAKTVKR